MGALDAKRYAPRAYVGAATDGHSRKKAARLEEGRGPEAAAAFCYHAIPRSREVGQSFATSVGTTLYSLWFALKVVYVEKPDLVLVNGPGTCIPICSAYYALRLAGLVPNGHIVYVESIARVARFSLSAKILYHLRMADELFVQWQQLKDAYPRSTFLGRIM